MIDSSKKNEVLMPHLCSDFFLWMCYVSEQDKSTFEFQQELSSVILPVAFWVDDRISFRSPSEEQTRAVVIGETLFQTHEAYAAIQSGKVIQDLRLFLRVYEREYSMTLKAPYLDLSTLKFPEHETDGDVALILERMSFYNEVMMALEAIYQLFVEIRLSTEWDQLLSDIRSWVYSEGRSPS
jgi:hypothetical protein